MLFRSQHQLDRRDLAESQERDASGEGENESKDEHDLSHWTAALGYALAALMLERATGASYRDLAVSPNGTMQATWTAFEGGNTYVIRAAVAKPGQGFGTAALAEPKTITSQPHVSLVSDGADTASDTGIRELRTALLHTDVFVYAIGIDSADRRTINAAVNPLTLSQITDQSGGRTRIVHDMTEVATALAQIADELNSQYLLGYTSPHAADGKYHSIRVHVIGGSYHVRARNGYVG